jgi:pyruvate formate lyase activating enzyme
MNIQGQLYTLVYGDVSSLAANPIEKKPFFHFWPGSYAFTIGTWSCNFLCPWCQNWDISKCEPRPEDANYINPEKLVRLTLAERCNGVSISFNEPTLLFEYCLDLFPLARKKGLYNTYVSNGYMTSEALSMLGAAGMDAIKFDVKGGSEAVKRYCGADADVVWRNVAEAKRLGMHIEVVVLVIPNVNDDDSNIREIVSRHVDNAGVDTPLHFTQFYPTHEMTDREMTPVYTLEKAHRTAKEMGVRYVYTGNVPGHRFENTYCPNCENLLIKRFGFDILNVSLTENKRCPKCGENIPIVGPVMK